MKVTFFKTPRMVEIREVKRLVAGDDEVLVKVEACGICGSDAIAYQEHHQDWHRRGHEYAGVVESAGKGVKGVQAGQLVAGIGSLPCGICSNCRAGKPEYCLQPRWCGGDGFAEYVCKEEDFFLPVPGLNAEEAALIEPLTVAMELVKDAQIPLMGKALIIGAGPIGLMALKLCKLCGAGKVYVFHRSTSTARLQAAWEFGADEVMCPDKEDVVVKMRKLAPEGIDSVLITAKPSDVISQAVDVTAIGGTIAFVGMEWGRVVQLQFDVDKFHFAKMRLVGSNHNPCNRLYHQAAELLQTKQIDASKLISHRFKLEEIKSAFDFIAQHKPEVVKVMIVD